MAITQSCSPFTNQVELFIWQYLWMKVISTGTAEAIEGCSDYVNCCPLVTLGDGYSELELANWCSG
jgi:hypothetical protein